MQMMSWMLARLGSRFALFFEPAQRRVMHSALGRFLDQPLDLKVGLVEPGGAHRVLPFCKEGELLANCEQFERLNSVTFRGHSERYGLRFEFNVHSVFYPQDETLCIMPAFYMEMRVNPLDQPIRGKRPIAPTPEKVKLFIRLQRPATQIKATQQKGGRIDLDYAVDLTPNVGEADLQEFVPLDARHVAVCERIQSLNTGCEVDPDGQGLTLEIPVTEVGSGTKWRLVWGAFCGDPILEIQRKGKTESARFRYLQLWTGIESVMEEAIGFRDDRLAHSRRFEKLLEQASLLMSQRHIFHLSFQTFLSNTFWCDTAKPIVEDDPNATHGATHGTDWFSLWDGASLRQSAVDVEFNQSLFYLSLWPYLLSVQFDQWADYVKDHAISGGAFLSHDVGLGLKIRGQSSLTDMPVEVNSDFLLMMQAQARWAGDLTPAKKHADLIEKLAKYLAWCDRDSSGFASEGIVSGLSDADPPAHLARKQTALSIKRLAGLQAAADLLALVGRPSSKYEKIVEADTKKLEAKAWLGDHYAVCVEKSAMGLSDPQTRRPLTERDFEGWESYTITTSNGLLLPAMSGQPMLLDHDRMCADLLSASRESLGNYGSGLTSVNVENLWISQNLWRDLLVRYMGTTMMPMVPRYWDLQIMSNTGQQSFGYTDAYISSHRGFSARGSVSVGMLAGGPRLVIDKFAPGGARISVEPDREYAQRWPLIALGDWRAGKIPVCVVDAKGQVTIECEIDPVIIHGDAAPSGVIG